MKKLFVLLFDQLETDRSENIYSFPGGLWAADLRVTQKKI